MTLKGLMVRGLIHHWRRHLPVLFGVAVSTAVLTGALMARDSIQGSLLEITESRLGEIEFAAQTSDRYFTSALADAVSGKSGRNVAAAILTEGIAIIDGGTRRVNGVRVIGIDDAFADMGASFAVPREGEVLINRALAEQLGAVVGQEILLRIRLSETMPGEAPLSMGSGTASARVVVEIGTTI